MKDDNGTKMGIISILYIAASICYVILRGNAFSNDVILTGEILDDNKTEVVKLKCKSSKEPVYHAVEFFVDHITADTVKLDKGKCYNSAGECSEKICMCLNAGNDFIWIFYPTDVLKKYVFGCQVRSFDENNNIFKTTATLWFDGSGFIAQDQKDGYVVINPVDITNSNVHDNDSDSIPITAGIISSVVFVIAVIVIALIAVYYRKHRRKPSCFGEFELSDRKLSKCDRCSYKTEYAICSTHIGIFCEFCAHKHAVHCKDILQLGSTSNKNKNKRLLECSAKCFVCKTNEVNLACVNCKQLFCETCKLCKCSESTNGDTIKSIFLPNKDDKRHRGTDAKLYMSNKNQEYGICSEETCEVNGMVIVDNKQLVIHVHDVEDKTNNCLKIMDKNSWHKTDRQSKLIGLTWVHGNVLAAIFENEKKIKFLEVLDNEIIYTDTEIELKSIGQPYQIVYNKNHFAVRIGQEPDVRFVVLSVDGTIQYMITNDEQRFGECAENSLEIALSDRYLFLSSSNNDSVYCIKFNGTILWKTEVSCPKGILYLSNTAFFGLKNIILACQNSSLIYQMDSQSGKVTLLLDEKDGINMPRYVAYKETEKEYILYTHTNTGNLQEFTLKPISK